jgi:uncharacterized protein (TIGR02271 family)
MKNETVVTVYDTAAHALAAKGALEAAGFPSGDMSMIGRDKLMSDGGSMPDTGLWQRIFGPDLRESEAEIYTSTVKQGGAVLSVRVPESEVPRVAKILQGHKSIDVRERAMAMKKPLAAKLNGEEEVIRLAEEEMHVGKRQIKKGEAHVRRFVTTKEVEAPVTLHEEHLEIIRRVAADPNSLADIDWQDRTIDIIETDEEPVVSKTAHIAEEIVVRRTGSDRVETVHGTVRRQQVEVDRGPRLSGKA